MGIQFCEEMRVLDLGNPQELQMSMFLLQSSMRLIMSNWMSSLKVSRSLRYWLQSLASSISQINYNNGRQNQQIYNSPAIFIIDLIELLRMREEGMKSDKQSRLIQLLLAEAEENARIEQARALQSREARPMHSEEGDRNMRNITEKLNRLEKTLLKKGQNKENFCHLSTAKKDKYAELNHLNDQLRRTLAKITGGKGGINAQEIQKKVISLYNNSVATLNSQDRLNKQLTLVEENREGIDREIKQARTELERGKVQLEDIVALRQLSLRRLKRLLP